MSRRPLEFLVEVRRELQLQLEFPDNKMETAKEEHKEKLLDYMKVLKTKCDFAIAEAKKVYNCSIALLLARRECNGTRSCMKCTPRTPGLA
jgi:hypothetical protein